jgi:hypothetical protein
MKMNPIFFVLFLITWAVGLVAVNNFSWVFLANLSLIALIVIYIARAEAQRAAFRR